MVRRNARPGAAEETVKRQAGRLAERIPEGAVERRDADYRHALVTEKVDVFPRPRPELRDVPGVAADQQLAEFLDHLHQHLGAPIVEGEDKVLADDARVAAHAHEDAAEAANLPERAADRLVERDRHGRRVDAGDLHARAPASMRVAAPLGKRSRIAGSGSQPSPGLCGTLTLPSLTRPHGSKGFASMSSHS